MGGSSPVSKMAIRLATNMSGRTTSEAGSCLRQKPRPATGWYRRDSEKGHRGSRYECHKRKSPRDSGPLQLCAGHPVGVESAIHAMKKFFTDDDSDEILPINADNAFNRINRKVALWNIQHTCPALKHIIINFYRSSSQIYVNSEGFFSLLSQEGLTQGCSLAMAMYALGLAPMVKKLQPTCKQVWFADDASGCDELVKLKRWYDD